MLHRSLRQSVDSAGPHFENAPSEKCSYINRENMHDSRNCGHGNQPSIEKGEGRFSASPFTDTDYSIKQTVMKCCQSFGRKAETAFVIGAEGKS